MRSHRRCNPPGAGARAARQPRRFQPKLPLRFGLTPVPEVAELIGGYIEAAFGLEQPIDLLGGPQSGQLMAQELLLP